MTKEIPERTRIELCEMCTKICLFDLRKVAGSRQKCKCKMCKKLNECFTYEIKTRGVVIHAQG